MGLRELAVPNQRLNKQQNCKEKAWLKWINQQGSSGNALNSVLQTPEAVFYRGLRCVVAIDIARRNDHCVQKAEAKIQAETYRAGSCKNPSQTGTILLIERKGILGDQICLMAG